MCIVFELFTTKVRCYFWNFIPTSPGHLLDKFKQTVCIWLGNFLGITSHKVKVRLSTPEKKLFCYPQWKPFKNNENCFLFHPESFFCSWKFVFVPQFSVMRENDLIRKLRLIPKFMTWITSNYNTHIDQYLRK